MSRPEQFTINTDYATIKNDGANNSLSVVVPSSVSVAGGTIYSVSDVVSVGSVSSNIRAQVWSSKDDRWVLGAAVSYSRMGIASGSPASYEVLVTVTRESSTTVRLTAFIRNPYNVTLTGASGTETIHAEVRTFLSPFV